METHDEGELGFDFTHFGLRICGSIQRIEEKTNNTLSIVAKETLRN